jgi:hypothetical protein
MIPKRAGKLQMDPDRPVFASWMVYYHSFIMDLSWVGDVDQSRFSEGDKE